MAGDWIKVEHATIDKPEVLRAAEMLGIERRECLGLFFDFWIWLDKNLSEICPDFVRNVSRKSLDDVLHCDGFAATLESIGWAKWDDKTWTLHVVNADRHNGNTAKTRALDADRKRKQRAKSVRVLSGKCPEKVTPRGRDRVSNKQRAVLHEPTTEHRALAATLGLNCDDQFQRYTDWQSSTGKSHKDQVAGFRNWLKNAKGIGPAKPIRGVVVGDWWRSEQGVERHARELGMWPARPGETNEQFIARLQAVRREVA